MRDSRRITLTLLAVGLAFVLTRSAGDDEPLGRAASSANQPNQLDAAKHRPVARTPAMASNPERASEVPAWVPLEPAPNMPPARRLATAKFLRPGFLPLVTY